MPDQLAQRGHFETPNASRYMQQLCKHFAHKIEVEYDEHAASAALSTGPVGMTASATALEIRVTAHDAAGLAQARGVIDKHLARFAFREGFETMTWHPPEHG